MIPLTRNQESSIPLEAQLPNQLRQLLLGVAWSGHRCLPSGEPQFVAEPGISRATIHKALEVE